MFSGDEKNCEKLGSCALVERNNVVPKINVANLLCVFITKFLSH